MNVLRLTTASILLAGFTTAGADTLTEENGTALQADSASAPEPETEIEAGWASRIRSDGSIMAQANAVFAALNPDQASRDVFEPEPDRVEIAGVDVDSNEIRDGNGSEGCRYMEIPGSRIRELRCYYPSEGEKALNEYQFREEIRYMVDHVEQLELIRQQGQAMIDAYSEMFRRR